MKILMITENDPAGMGIAFCNAINRYTEHSCRLITKEIRYNFMFKKDIHLPWLDQGGWDEVEDLLESSDVFHFHMTSDEYTEIGPFRAIDFIRGKRIVHHHHGHPDFRGDPEKYRRKYLGTNRIVIVSTPDLLKLIPEAIWVPNIVPLNNALLMPVKGNSDMTVRVCQAPTRKDLKNTKNFQNVLELLVSRHNNLEYMIIENVLYSECLRTKQKHDIHFDHMQGYFGVSSLESLSQGKPVIAGLDPWNIESVKQFTGKEEIPWSIVRNEKQLEDVLTELIVDEDLRRDRGIKSREFMETCWSEAHVLERLLNTYEVL